MTIKRYNPDTVCAPAAPYYQNTEVPAGVRWLVTAGQVGIKPDGTLIKDCKGQIKQTWENVRAVVEAAGMTPDDIVKLTIYVTDMGRRAEVSEARKEVFADHLPASTFLQVSGFIQDGLLVEVDAIAHL